MSAAFDFASYRQHMRGVRARLNGGLRAPPKLPAPEPEQQKQPVGQRDFILIASARAKDIEAAVGAHYIRAISKAAKLGLLDGLTGATIPATGIIASVCVRHNVSFIQLASQSRHEELVKARQEAYALISRELGWSTPKIGALFHRDHTSIIHAIRCWTKRQAGEEYGYNVHRRLHTPATHARVAELRAAGLSTKEIARTVNLSVNQVSGIIRRIVA